MLSITPVMQTLDEHLAEVLTQKQSVDHAIHGIFTCVLDIVEHIGQFKWEFITNQSILSIQLLIERQSAWPRTQRCQTRLSESVSLVFVDTGSWDGDKVFAAHIKQTRQADKTSRFHLHRQQAALPNQVFCSDSAMHGQYSRQPYTLLSSTKRGILHRLGNVLYIFVVEDTHV